jgi:branched-chain amino acid transport system ATP-binding protein
LTEPLLELEKVNTAYGDSHVIHDISLYVNEGETVTILGRNGAGKTTTLRSILGVPAPFSGTVRFAGEDIMAERTYEIARRGIKYVPEERRVFGKLTVLEHLTMALRRSQRSTDEELSEVYTLFPDLENINNQTAETLSGGQKQMLVIARALIGPTRLLLLDEPFEGLAPKIISNISEAIGEIQTDTTVVLVEQNFEVAKELASRYYILDQGEVVSDGPMNTLVVDEELKERYLGLTQ